MSNAINHDDLIKEMEALLKNAPTQNEIRESLSRGSRSNSRNSKSQLKTSNVVDSPSDIAYISPYLIPNQASFLESPSVVRNPKRQSTSNQNTQNDVSYIHPPPQIRRSEPIIQQQRHSEMTSTGPNVEIDQNQTMDFQNVRYSNHQKTQQQQYAPNNIQQNQEPYKQMTNSVVQQTLTKERNTGQLINGELELLKQEVEIKRRQDLQRNFDKIKKILSEDILSKEECYALVQEVVQETCK
ncbi:Hypothetical_protein [Hexamita inflata]|uniref:Hypothetical_protein n=1 Tax=Hexamita inflata TaxID=28002 RepID=A0AA86NCL3_9EUKA|nr:Hypothetical protein HINF_LOCUS4947 [Hexamita inflata]CAI9931137.1 Hypothetical protein HINF_LOCUS18782 [Hexamita inflata]